MDYTACDTPGNGFPGETAADPGENSIKDSSTVILKENWDKCTEYPGPGLNPHICGQKSIVQQEEKHENTSSQEGIGAKMEYQITTETDIDITAEMLPSGRTQSHFHVVRTAVSETSSQQPTHVGQQSNILDHLIDDETSYFSQNVFQVKPTAIITMPFDSKTSSEISQTGTKCIIAVDDYIIKPTDYVTETKIFNEMPIQSTFQCSHDLNMNCQTFLNTNKTFSPSQREYSENHFVTNQINKKNCELTCDQQQKSPTQLNKINCEFTSDLGKSEIQIDNTTDLYSDLETLRLNTQDHKKDFLKSSINDMENKDDVYMNPSNKSPLKKSGPTEEIKHFNAQGYIQNGNAQVKDIASDKLYNTSSMTKVWHVPRPTPTMVQHSIDMKYTEGAKDLRDLDYDLVRDYCLQVKEDQTFSFEEKGQQNQTPFSGVNKMGINDLGFKNNYTKWVELKTCSEETDVTLGRLPSQLNISIDSSDTGMSTSPETDTNNSKSITVGGELQDHVTSVDQIQKKAAENSKCSDRSHVLEDIKEMSNTEPALCHSSSNTVTDALLGVQTDYPAPVYIVNLTAIKALNKNDSNGVRNQGYHRDEEPPKQKQEPHFPDSRQKNQCLLDCTNINRCKHLINKADINFKIPIYHNKHSLSGPPKLSVISSPYPSSGNATSSSEPPCLGGVSTSDPIYYSTPCTSDSACQSRASPSHPLYQSLTSSDYLPYQNTVYSVDAHCKSTVSSPGPANDSKVFSPDACYQSTDFPTDPPSQIITFSDPIYQTSSYDTPHQSKTSFEDPAYQNKIFSDDSIPPSITSSDDPSHQSISSTDDPLCLSTTSPDDPPQQSTTSLDNLPNQSTMFSDDLPYQSTTFFDDLPNESPSSSDNPPQKSTTSSDDPSHRSINSSDNPPHQSTVSSDDSPHQRTISFHNPPHQSTTSSDGPSHPRTTFDHSPPWSTTSSDNDPHQSTTSSDDSLDQCKLSFDNPLHQNTTSYDDSPRQSTNSSDDPSHPRTTSDHSPQWSTTSSNNDPHQSTASSDDSPDQCKISFNNPLHQNTTSYDDSPHQSTNSSDNLPNQSPSSSDDLPHQNTTCFVDTSHQSMNFYHVPSHQSTTSFDNSPHQCITSSDNSPHWGITSSDDLAHQSMTSSDDPSHQSTASSHGSLQQSTYSPNDLPNQSITLFDDPSNQSTTSSNDSPHQSTTSYDNSPHQSITSSGDLAYQSITLPDDPSHQNITSSDDLPHQNSAPTDDPSHQGTTSSNDSPHQSTTSNDDPPHLSKTSYDNPPHQSKTSFDDLLDRSRNASDDLPYQSTMFSDDPPHQSLSPSKESPHESTTSFDDALHQSTTSSEEPLHHSATSSDEPQHQSLSLAIESLYQSTTSTDDLLHQSMTWLFDSPLWRRTPSDDELHCRATSSADPQQQSTISSYNPPHQSTVSADDSLHLNTTSFDNYPYQSTTFLGDPSNRSTNSSDDPSYQSTIFSDDPSHHISSPISCGDSAHQSTTSSDDPSHKGIASFNYPSHQGTTSSDDSPHQSTTFSDESSLQRTTSMYDPPSLSTTSSDDPLHYGATSSAYLQQKSTTSSHNLPHQDIISSDNPPHHSTMSSDYSPHQSTTSFDDPSHQSTASFDYTPHQSKGLSHDSYYQSRASFPDAANDTINASAASIYQTTTSCLLLPYQSTTCDPSHQSIYSLGQPYQDTNYILTSTYQSNTTFPEQSNQRGNITSESSPSTDPSYNCTSTSSVPSSLCHALTTNLSDFEPLTKPIQDEFGMLVKQKDHAFLEESRRIFLDFQGQGLSMLDSGIVLTKNVTVENSIAFVALRDGSELGMLAPPSKLFFYYQLGKHFYITKQLSEHWYCAQDRITKVTMLMKKVPVTSNWMKILRNFLLLPEHPRILTPYAAITNRNGSVIFLMEGKPLLGTRSLGMLPLRYEINIPARIWEIIFFLRYCKINNVLPRNIEDSILYTPQGIWFDPSSFGNNDDLCELQKCLKVSLSVFLCRGQQAFDPCLEALLRIACLLLEDDQIYQETQGPIPFSFPPLPNMN